MLTEQSVTVHRGHVLKEMIQEFKDVDSFLRSLDVILANKMYESADNGGVRKKKKNYESGRGGVNSSRLHDL